MVQPRESPYYFELASTVHKWLQGTTQEEQEVVLRIRGFVRWLVIQLVANSKPKSPSMPSDAQQVLLDLTGELIKFNHQVIEIQVKNEKEK